MNLLALIPLRAWLIAGALAVLGAILWHDHHISRLYKAEHAKTTELTAKVAAKERELAMQKEASNAYQQSLEDLRAARAATPVRAVRLCRPATVVPGAAGGSAAPGKEAVSPADGSDLEAGPDIGPELYGLADEADECAVQRDALIDWYQRRQR
jgi:hypothetical protein